MLELTTRFESNTLAKLIILTELRTIARLSIRLDFFKGRCCRIVVGCCITPGEGSVAAADEEAAMEEVQGASW